MTSNLSETPNNRQRAAEMINLWELSRRAGRDTPGAMHIVQALEAAGLLMPDLPEPLENSAGEDQWDEPTVVTQSSSGEVVIEDRVAVWHSDLRPLALVLLAAENNYREHLS